MKYIVTTLIILSTLLSYGQEKKAPTKDEVRIENDAQAKEVIDKVLKQKEEAKKNKENAAEKKNQQNNDKQKTANKSTSKINAIDEKAAKIEAYKKEEMNKVRRGNEKELEMTDSEINKLPVKEKQKVKKLKANVRTTEAQFKINEATMRLKKAKLEMAEIKASGFYDEEDMAERVKIIQECDLALVRMKRVFAKTNYVLNK